MAIRTETKHDSVKVLLIEDDEDDYILTRDLLQDVDGKRFDLEWSSTFQDGLGKIKANSYDLCLVDYRLGEKTGIDFIQAAKKWDNTLPFVMLTGENNRDIDLQAMRIGAYDYLMKGTLEPVTLERTIRYTLERKHTEEKLRKAEARYRTYFENAVEGIFQTSPEGKLLAANPALSTITGYDNPEDMIHNMPNLDAIYVNPKRRRRLLSLASKKGQANNFESQVYKKDGSIIWISENIRTMYDGKGKPLYYEGTVQDITFKKHAEEEKEKLIREQIARKEAEAAQRRLQFLADASKLFSSSLLNKKNMQQVMNILIPEFADWCTIDTLKTDGTLTSHTFYHKDTKKQRLGQELCKMYPLFSHSNTGIYAALQSKAPQLYQHLPDRFVQNISHNEKHFLMLKELGLESVIIVPMLLHNEVYGAISIVRDEKNIPFTKEDLLFAEELATRAASAIENANLYEQAKEGIRVRDEFLNIASHELKTPLTSLQLQMQILLKIMNNKDKILSHEELDNLLKSSTKQIRRLAQLINDLLDVSRISNKKLELSFEEGSYPEIVEGVIERFRGPIHNSDSVIITNIEKDIHGIFDKSRFDQIVTNLLSNALKYGKGNAITVTLHKDAGNAILTVKDKGIGMSKKETEKIFDRFERTETAKQYGGVGLGLYIVNEIVKAHNGSVTVESEQGKGSTFTVSLPLKPSSTRQ